MKRLIILTTLFVFAFGMPCSISANFVEYQNMSKFCEANNDLGYQSHGKCVSIMMACENFGDDGPLCSCKEFLNKDPAGFYEMYNNIGECINYLELGYVAE
jgi:hypothetical protein